MAKAKRTIKKVSKPKSKGGAPKGNLNALVWDEASVLVELAKIETEAKKKTCLYLGSALVSVGLYKEIWSYWKEVFKDNMVVFQPIKRIEQIFEDRLFTGALKNDLNPTTAIFGLKNNHDWKDKSETELSGKDGKDLFNTLTEEQINERIQKLLGK